MTKEEPEIIKQGYQPIHSKNASVIPPNAGSHVRMKGKGYTWEDLDKAWWEGFDNAKNKMGKRIAELEKENAELKEQIKIMKCPLNCKNGSVYNWSDNSICMDCEKVRTLHEDNWQELCKGCEYWERR